MTIHEHKMQKIVMRAAILLDDFNVSVVINPFNPQVKKGLIYENLLNILFFSFKYFKRPQCGGTLKHVSVIATITKGKSIVLLFLLRTASA